MAAVEGCTGSSGRHGRGVPELSQRRLKEQVVSFYAQNNVMGSLEKLLNTMYLDKPADVHGYMSDYFHRLSQDPTISRLVVSHGFDNEGEEALMMNIYCIVHGEEQLVSTLCWPMLTNSPKTQIPMKSTTTKGKDKTPTKTSPTAVSPVEEVDQPPLYTKADTSITDHIALALKGQALKNQQQIDEVMCQISQSPPIHPSALTFVSFAVAQAAAKLLSTPLFSYLTDIFKLSADAANRFSLPLPITTVVAGGQLGCGKLKVRSFCLSSLPSCTVQEQVKNITATYREIGRNFGSVLSSCRLPASGAYCVATDKVEQILDLIRGATDNLGLQLNRDVSLFVDVGAERFYDEDKNKYEVIAGQWKTGEEMLGLYATWLSSYPGLLGFIDPLHPKDKVGWEKSTEVLQNRCLLIADRTLQDIEAGAKKTGSSVEGSTNVSVSSERDCNHPNPVVPNVSLFSCATLSTDGKVLSDVFAEASRMRDQVNYLILQGSGAGHTGDSLRALADLGVSLRCKFIRCDAPVGLTSTVLFSRLLQIRAELGGISAYEPSSALQLSLSHHSMKED